METCGVVPKGQEVRVWGSRKRRGGRTSCPRGRGRGGKESSGSKSVAAGNSRKVRMSPRACRVRRAQRKKQTGWVSGSRMSTSCRASQRRPRWVPFRRSEVSRPPRSGRGQLVLQFSHSDPPRSTSATRGCRSAQRGSCAAAARGKPGSARGAPSRASQRPREAKSGFPGEGAEAGVRKELGSSVSLRPQVFGGELPGHKPRWSLWDGEAGSPGLRGANGVVGKHGREG